MPNIVKPLELAGLTWLRPRATQGGVLSNKDVAGTTTIGRRSLCYYNSREIWVTARDGDISPYIGGVWAQQADQASPQLEKHAISNGLLML